MRKRALRLLASVPEAFAGAVELGTLTRVGTAILEAEGRTGVHEVELSVVDEDEVQRLNQEFRGLDEVTDVLSFPLHEHGEDDAFFAVPPDEVDRLGDLVICLPRAVEQAAEFGHSPRREIAYLFAHGLLHLLGYDHELEEERRAMREREEGALATVGLTR